MAAPHGFEPRLTESESAVLPLDDGAIGKNRNLYIPIKNKMQIFFSTNCTFAIGRRQTKKEVPQNLLSSSLKFRLGKP